MRTEDSRFVGSFLMERVGIFGGSFDPIHFGHLWIAEAAKEALDLQEVRWIPAAQSPLKASEPRASAEDRIAMIRLALSGCEYQVIDDREIRRGSVSYTVDTMAELKEEFPDREHWLILGSDSLHSLGQWHQPQRLLQLVDLAIIQRGGEPDLDFSVLDGLVSPDRIDRIRSQVVRMPVIELSSSELRARIANGRSIRYRTPRAVEALIQDRQLYRASS